MSQKSIVWMSGVTISTGVRRSNASIDSNNKNSVVVEMELKIG
jgi:hypothetical protein